MKKDINNVLNKKKRKSKEKRQLKSWRRLGLYIIIKKKIYIYIYNCKKLAYYH